MRSIPDPFIEKIAKELGYEPDDYYTASDKLGFEKTDSWNSGSQYSHL